MQWNIENIEMIMKGLEIHVWVSNLYMGLNPNLKLDKLVEKRKMLYFGLAGNLIWHLISTNQDDLSYSARTFISGYQIG